MDPTQAIAWHDDVEDQESNVEEIPKILVSLTVKDKDKVFELQEGTHSIGRTDDNKIVLSYASISKKHALLEVSKSSNSVYCFITDCGSLNKTRLCRSDDEKGIVLTPNTRYEILPGSKLIFGDVTCLLTDHTVDKEPAIVTPVNTREEHAPAAKSESVVFKKPISLEATQAYEVTDEELLNDLMQETRDVVPNRHASKWGPADHATQPYDESDSTTLGSMNNTLGNASLKSDASTVWFKKDKHNKEELASTQAYDEESTQGPERAEIKVIVTAPTQAYEETEDRGHKDEAATQAYDEPMTEVNPINNNNATLAYDDESDVPMKDVNATLAYEEPSSPVKTDNNATQAYEEPSSPVKTIDNNATQAYEEPSSPKPIEANNNNATQAYDEPSSPVKVVDNNATQAYEEPPSPIKTSDNNATQAYEEPSSPPKLIDVNATLAYDENHSAEDDNNNATQAYEEPPSPKLIEANNNNATQAYDEPSSPVKPLYSVAEDHPPVTPSKTTKVVTFAEVTVTQVYEEAASPQREELDNNNATLPIIEHSPPEMIDNNATLPIAEHDSPDSMHEDKMEIDRPEVINKHADEEPSSLFHDSHQHDKHSPPLAVHNETRHSDSSDTQGPAQSKVTVRASSNVTTSIVERTIDNEATLMIVDSTEIKNNESLEATLRLPSTPPVHASADSLSDEAVESMPSDLWFIKHKDQAADEAEPSLEHTNDAHTEQPHPPPHNELTRVQSTVDQSDEHTENKTAVSENEPSNQNSTNVTEHNTHETDQPKSRTPRRTALRKSLSPTRARTKIEPEEGEQEAPTTDTQVTEDKVKTSAESQQSATEGPRSTRGRRKSKSDVSESPLEHTVQDSQSTKRATRRNSSVNNNVAVKEEHPTATSSQPDSSETTPRKTNKRKLSQVTDDSPRATKRVKASPEVKSSQDKAVTRRTSTGSDVIESDTHSPHILFTGFPEDTLKKYAKTVETLGGHVIADLKHVTECTHLVTDSAQRTVKFLAALNCVKHVVTSKWIEKCQKQHSFVDESSFALRDHTAERKFDFHLEQSLQRASAGKVFEGVSFVLTASVKPVPDDLKVIIAAAGGKCVKTAPKKTDPATVIIACAEDLELARTLHAQGYRVYTPEFVLSSVIRQQVNYEDNLLPDVIAPEQERTKNRKKK